MIYKCLAVMVLKQIEFRELIHISTLETYFRHIATPEAIAVVLAGLEDHGVIERLNGGYLKKQEETQTHEYQSA